MVEVATTEDMIAHAATVGSQLSALASRVDALEQGPQPKPTGSLPVPRVISADECREGMRVHARFGPAREGDLYYERRQGTWEDGKVYYGFGHDLYVEGNQPKQFDIIVLLAEAP